MKPYSVNDVANYIIFQFKEDGVSLVNLKLQKLVYYVQVWSFGIYKEKFIDCSFEAWVHGPVCRDLYDRFKGLYTFVTTSETEYHDAIANIKESDRQFIDYILDNYGCFSGSELEAMSHREDPWIDARNGLSSYEFSSRKISEESISTYYGKKWEEIQSNPIKN